jgi:tetratricopeptide (TPR) repeat protein/transcriptional regulator with XRE-family HTH domain
VTTRFNHELLARTRLELDLTQEQAAAALGVDVRTYRRYESGEVNALGSGLSARHPRRRRMLLGICEQFGLDEQELLVESTPPSAAETETAAKIEPTWLPRHAHALPRAQHFVGRDSQLKRLDEWSSDAADSTRVFSLIGIGGSGKTSLVERFLRGRGDAAQKSGLFVFSFYEDERVEAFIEQALAYFGCTPLVSRGERLDALEAVLRESRLPHLIVLDGLEVQQSSGQPTSTFGRIEDGALRRLLRSAARGLGASHWLITSRIELSDLAGFEGSGLYTERMDSLSVVEARTLLASWGIENPTDVRALVERTGGHALSIAMLGSYLGAFLRNHDALRHAELARLLTPEVLEPRTRDSAPARRLLDVLTAYASALSELERDVMARLAIFPAGVDVALLARVAQMGAELAGSLAGLGPSELIPILARLERLGLVFAADGGESFTTHPFVAEHFRALLGAKGPAIHAFESSRLTTELDRHGVEELGRERLDAYELLFQHLIASNQQEAAAQIYLRRLGGFPELGLRLGAMSRGARMLRAFTSDGDPATLGDALSAPRRARIAYDLGLYVSALGDLDLALRCYKSSLVILRDAANLEGVAMSLRTLAYTERLRGELASALSLSEQSVELAELTMTPHELVRSVALRASILHDLGRTREASREFERARELGDEPFARRALWEAEHWLEIGEVERAVSSCERQLQSLMAARWQGHVAHCHVVLGRALLERSPADSDAARSHARAARRWTAETAEVEMVLRCLELEARLARSESNRAAAADLLARGTELAQSSGFALFRKRFETLRAEWAY